MADRAVIVNLTRFGDLLQCQPLISQLHESGLEVGLVCLENFVRAVPLLRHVHTAWPLPGARLLAQSRRNWHEAVATLHGLTSGIRDEFQARHVINLTPSLPARLLSRLLTPASGQLLGFGMDEDGFGDNADVWASFLCATTLRRQNAPFNVSDMFRMVGQRALQPRVAARSGDFSLVEPDEQAQAKAAALLQQIVPPAEGKGEVRGFVGFQLGASEARRQWPVAHFARLGGELWRRQGLVPVLLGVHSELPLGGEYAACTDAPHVNAIDRTSIPELAALLRQCRLLVTNDTGTMHLAAGMGVPSLAFFLATAQPHDTGPGLEGCCCLEPALPCHPCAFGQSCPHDGQCRSHIRPEPVAELVLARLSAGQWPTQAPRALAEQARVWLTGRDDKGFVTVLPLSDHGAEDRSRWLVQQRVFWCHILDILEGAGSPQAMRTALEALPPCSPGFRAQVGPVLAQAVSLLAMLAEQGRLVGRSPKAGQLFMRNCDRLHGLLSASPQLAALGHFWQEVVQMRAEHLDQLLDFEEKLAQGVAIWAETINAGA